jgi:hypothetical protein
VDENDVWGLQWKDNKISPKGVFPQYYKQVGKQRVAIPASEVPKETGLLKSTFKLAKPGEPFTSPSNGAWSKPGPVKGPFKTKLIDGSVVTYSWYRFVDQPSFQQYKWSRSRKAKLQRFIEKVHAHWTIDRNYMPPPSSGELVALDAALLVTPPKGLEIGFVPIVTRQEAAQ